MATRPHTLILHAKVYGNHAFEIGIWVVHHISLLLAMLCLLVRPVEREEPEARIHLILKMGLGGSTIGS